MDTVVGLLGCAVDLERGLVLRGGATAPLTGRELEVLRYLIARAGTTVERDELLRELWGTSTASRACDKAIWRLRSKVELHPESPDHVLTVHGSGYTFRPLAGPLQPPVDAPTPQPIELYLGDRVVDLGRGQVRRRDGAVERLTAREIALLERLRACHGVAMDRARLSREVCGQVVGRALEALVYRLRRKIEPEPESPIHLLHVPGGYRLELPVSGPAPAQPLYGRDADLDALSAAVGAPGVAAVLGPGGVGKTALARVVASRTSALWVSAGGMTSTGDLIRAVGRALEMTNADSASAHEVAQTLARTAPRVVVLDEMESLAGASSELLELWASGTSALLVTSRVRLRADVTIELGPLDVGSAATLFLARARRYGLADDSATRSKVEQWVERLDRLPLAIELSAGRLSVLSVEDQQHQPLLELLGGGEPGRHASIRDTLVGSWRALDDHLRDGLLTLACFRSFTTEDAQRVLPGGLEVVQALRDRSWIAPLGSADGHLVLGLLEVVRAFVEAQRAEDPDADRERWLRHVRTLAQLGQPEDLERLGDVLDPAQLARLRRLTPDLCHAAEVASSLSDWATAARCTEAAASALHRSGRFEEAAAIILRWLSRAPDGGADRARLLYQRSAALRSLGQPTAYATAQAAREIAVAIDDPVVEARALCVLAHVRRDAEAADLAARAAVRAGLPHVVAWARHLSGLARGVPDPEASLQNLLVEASQIGAVAWMDRALFELGRHAMNRGAMALGAARFEQANRLIGASRTALMSLRTAAWGFFCRAHLDGDQELEALADDLAARFARADLPSLEITFHAGLGTMWLCADRPDRVRDLGRRLTTDPRYDPFRQDDEWGILYLLFLRAELELDRPHEVLAMASTLQTIYPDIQAARDMWAALAHARLGLVDVALREIAAVDLSTTPDRFFRHTVLARIHALGGDLDAAVRERDAAEATAVEGGFVATLAFRRELRAVDREIAHRK